MSESIAEGPPGTRVRITLHNLPGFLTAAPGLVAHKSFGFSAWTLTQLATSLRFNHIFDGPEQVQAYAAEVACLADWTAPLPDHEHMEIGRKCKEIAERMGGRLVDSGWTQMEASLVPVLAVPE